VGPSMNLLLALVILFVIFFFLVGTPRTDTTILGQVFKDSPAAAAGLQPGDTVISIDAVPVHNWAEMVALIESRPDETVAIVVRRDGEELEYAVQIEAVPEAGKGMIGVAAPVQKYRFAASLATSLERFGDVILSMYHVITGQAPFDVIGPVGIIITVGEVAQTGFINLLWLMSLFNISLGLLNLLPVPALDGGRLLFILVEAIRGRPLDPEKEALIHFIGFAVLMVLTLLVTYNDLLRWDIFPGR
jgi:regulator of sigma E protease